jgi:hypothetical protein
MEFHSRVSKGAGLLVLLLLLGTLLPSLVLGGGVDDPITGAESTGETPTSDEDPSVPTDGADALTECLLWWLTLVI